MILSTLYGYHFAIDTALRKEVFDNWKQKITKDAIKLNIPEEERETLNFKIAENLLLKSHPKLYHISKPVLEFARKIKIKFDSPFRWLYNIPDQISQYNFGNYFILFTKKDKKIVAFASSITPVNERYNYIHYDFFNIDLENGKINVPLTDSGIDAYALLLQLLSFIELSDIEEITLPPKKQHGYGSKKDPDNIHNDNPLPVILVNSRWTQRVYRPGEFQVTGHPRMQPKGLGRSEYELIWIETYVKKGITISAGKERN